MTINTVGVGLLCLLLLDRLQRLDRRGVQDARGVDQASVGVEYQTETRKIERLHVEVTLDWYRLRKNKLVGSSEKGNMKASYLVEKQVAKHRQHRLAIRAVRQVFLEWRVGLRNNEMVRIWSTGVRNDGDVICGSHRSNLEELGHTSYPHNIGLEDVKVTALDQLAEAVSRVLVLASGELHARVSTLELLETISVIWRQALLPPVKVEVLRCLDHLDCVGNVQRHVAVDLNRVLAKVCTKYVNTNHQREVWANTLAVLREEFNILLQAFDALSRSIWQRNLSTNKAHSLCGCRLGSSAVEVEPLSCRSTDQLVYWLVSDLAEEIPDGKVDDGNDGDWKTLPAVEHGSAVHLLEEVVRVARI